MDGEMNEDGMIFQMERTNVYKSYERMIKNGIKAVRAEK
jgi:hypothetical protein